MRLLYIILFQFFLFSLCFGEIKEFEKSATEAVPSHQSQEQVIQYVTQMLSREAIEEAGVFIRSNSELKDGKLTKDEIISITGSVAEINVTEKNIKLIDNKPFVSVTVKIKIDTEIVDSYLKKVQEDVAYKNEAIELRKRNLELEEKLKVSTSVEYDRNLSLEAEKVIAIQQKRALELQTLATEAKEALLKTEQEQRLREIERLQHIDKLKKRIEKEELETKKRIFEEKDAIKKAELENQARIQELENKAKTNVASWLEIDEFTAEEAIKEALLLRKTIDETNKSFEDKIKSNLKYLTESYDLEIKNIKEGKFSESEPTKDKWESSEDFQERVVSYNERKDKYLSKSSRRLSTLTNEKYITLLIDEHEGLKSMLSTLAPFLERMGSFQTSSFYSGSSEVASLISLDDPNPDTKTFIMNVKYDGDKYEVAFSFEELGIERARAIYETKAHFVITPKFSLSQKGGKSIEKVLTTFNVKHLGAGINVDLKAIGASVKKFAEFEQEAKYLARQSELIRKICLFYLERDKLSKLSDEDRQELTQLYIDNPKFKESSVFFYNSYLAGYSEVKEHLKEVYTLKDRFKWISSIYFSPDGRSIAAGIDNTVSVWDIATEKKIVELKNLNSIVNVMFSPTGKYILVHGSYFISIWNSTSFELIGTITKDILFHTVVFSPDEQYILANCYDSRTVDIYDIKSLSKIRTLKGHMQGKNSLLYGFSPDGRFVITGSNDATVIVWDIETGEEVKVLRGHSGVITAVSFSNDGKYIVSVCHKGTVTVWDFDTGEAIRQAELANHYSADVKFLYNGNIAIIARGFGIVIYNPKTEGTSTLKRDIIYDYSIFSPNGKCIAVEYDEEIGLFDGNMNKILTIPIEAKSFMIKVFSNDSQFIAINAKISKKYLAQVLFIGDICQ